MYWKKNREHKKECNSTEVYKTNDNTSRSVLREYYNRLQNKELSQFILLEKLKFSSRFSPTPSSEETSNMEFFLTFLPVDAKSKKKKKKKKFKIQTYFTGRIYCSVNRLIAFEIFTVYQTQ
jgi:hypothetical protein